MVSKAAELEIKEIESSDLLLSLNDVVMNRKKRGFSRLVGSVGRKKRVLNVIKP